MCYNYDLKNKYAVGINQIVGRICGNARPDLKRTLYSTKNVISKYTKYNENQKDFFDYLKSSNTDDYTKIIWKVFILLTNLTDQV